MQIGALGRNRRHRGEIEALFNGLAPGDERKLLQLFREEATTTVLQVRVWIEERRAEYEVREEAEEDELRQEEQMARALAHIESMESEGEDEGLPV